MEDRTVSKSDHPVKPDSNPIRWCLDKARSGSTLLWFLCAISWFVCGVCWLRVYHVEDRLESLESQFEQFRVLIDVPASHNDAKIKSIGNQVREMLCVSYMTAVK